MPKFSGWDFTQKLRRLALKKKKVPIIYSANPKMKFKIAARLLSTNLQDLPISIRYNRILRKQIRNVFWVFYERIEKSL